MPTACLPPCSRLHAPRGAPQEDNYQYYQALTRQPVERAFGMIERRWGILWRRIEARATPPCLHPAPTPTPPTPPPSPRPLSRQVPLRHVPVVVYTVFALHNLCMEFNVPELPMTGAGQNHFKALERSSDVLPESGRRRDLEQSALRLSLAAALAEYGMCRPPVAGVRRGAA